MTGAARRVVLAGLPSPLYDAARGYLGDVLRECHLVLLGRDQGSSVDADLVALAEGMVPDLEELRDLFAKATVTDVDGLRTLAVDLRATDAATLAHLHLQLTQLRFVDRMTQTDQALAQRMAAAVLAQHQLRAGKAHVFRAHDFVGAAVLQHAVLMDARLVREGVFADHGFVALDRLAGDLR